MKLQKQIAAAALGFVSQFALALDVHSDRLAHPFKALIMGHSFVAPIAEEFGDVVQNNPGFTNYEQLVHGCGGSGGDPLSLWQRPCTRQGPDNPMNLNEKQRIQSALDEGDIDLLVMTYHPDVHSLAGHRLWIDYAKAKNPDTVFAVILPWATEPCTWTEQTGTDYITFDDMLVQPSIDLLAQEKGVTIFFIPHGYGPMQLAKIYLDPSQSQHQIIRTDVQAFSLHTDPDTPNCRGNLISGDEAIFRDKLGHARPIAVRTAALIFGASIFDITFDGYSDSYLTRLEDVTVDVMRFTDSRHPEHKSPWRQ